VALARRGGKEVGLCTSYNKIIIFMRKKESNKISIIIIILFFNLALHAAASLQVQHPTQHLSQDIVVYLSIYDCHVNL
jgi:hypothetical protein